VEEALEGVVGGADEDKISGLATGLETEAGTAELDESWGAPAMTGAAADDALSVLSTEDEGSLFEAGNDGDASGFGCDVVRDAFVWGLHEFVKDSASGLDALIEFFDVCGGGGADGERHGERCGGAECLDEIFVHHISFSLVSLDFSV